MAQQPVRKSIRLPEYDYSQPGSYFFTICTAGRACVLGEVQNCEVRLSAMSEIVKQAWLAIPDHHQLVELDEMVIMPNHVHGILRIREDDRWMSLDGPVSPTTLTPPLENFAKRRLAGPEKGTLGAIIGSFKSAASRNINKHRGTASGRVWQENYYEHIIRDERSLDRIRAYIAGNPARWDEDEENPYRTAR